MHTHTQKDTGLAVSLMISHATQLTPLDSRLSPIMHHISSPGSELIKVAGMRGRWAEEEEEEEAEEEEEEKGIEGRKGRNEEGREKPVQ